MGLIPAFGSSLVMYLLKDFVFMEIMNQVIDGTNDSFCRYLSTLPFHYVFCSLEVPTIIFLFTPLNKTIKAERG